MRNLLLAIGTLVLGTTVAFAAGPMPDTFFVHFNDPVVISSTLTLPPGNYKFQRITHPTDPAVFTITNGDTRQVVGTTPSADVAEGKQDFEHPKSGVIVDQVNGKDYLDSVSLQGTNDHFVFPVASNIRDQAKSQGTQIRLDARAGGQD